MNTSASRTILLVEPNEDLREVIVELLESLGHRVLVAGRAESALRLYGRVSRNGASRPLDLLITEYLFPTLDGLTLGRCLRRVDPTLQVAVISSHDNHPYLPGAIDAGEVIFLRKPFSLDELQAALEEDPPEPGELPPSALEPFPHCADCHQPHCRPWFCSSNHSWSGA